MTDPQFHMVQMRLDARGLADLGRMLSLPLKKVDPDYLTHCAVGELFGDDAPKPFAIENSPHKPDPRFLRVLGYSALSDEALRSAADTFASPAVHKICDWTHFASKPMPALFETGTRLGFELTACPVQRMASSGEHWKKGAEVDVFLVESWEKGKDVKIDREEVYTRWLQDYFARRGGAEIENSGVVNFALKRVFRRTKQTRTAVTFTRPTATFQGTLVVTQPQIFHDLLRHGVGRHKAFGFGMLKLRRPGRR